MTTKKPKSALREYAEMVQALVVLHVIMWCVDGYHWAEDQYKKVKDT